VLKAKPGFCSSVLLDNLMENEWKTKSPIGLVRHIGKSNQHVRELGGITGLVVVETTCNGADFPSRRFIVGNLPGAD
jgi:hypothetical protein